MKSIRSLNPYWLWVQLTASMAVLMLASSAEAGTLPRSLSDTPATPDQTQLTGEPTDAIATPDQVQLAVEPTDTEQPIIQPSPDTVTPAEPNQAAPEANSPTEAAEQPATQTTPETATPVTPVPQTPGDVAQPVPTAQPVPQPNAPLDPLAVNILSPLPDSVLDAPAVTVTLQFVEGSEIELMVNGEPVSRSLIGRTETDSKTRQVKQIWYGVPLQAGENLLTAQATSNGVKGEIVGVKVVVSGPPKQLRLTTVETRIPADGKSTATVQGELLDEQGNRSKQDAIVTLTASSGEFVGADHDRDQPGFQVEAKQGQFTASLKSGLEARTVRIRGNTTNLEAFAQLEFEPNLRPSIATGVIDVRFGPRGTNFFGSMRDFLPADKDNSYELDVRSAFFATGRIGNWLFTGAYNSARPLNQTCDNTTRLFRDTQTCDQNYPVYGDSSTSQIVAPSKDSLYVRLERTSPVPGAGTDYFMWGDYNTEEFARRSQQFTATTRRLHGFKGNFNLGNLQISGFYGNNVDGFQRDTIAPDGTSGYYFLSRRLLVSGSEDVFIEMEELNRPGTVLDRKRLTRGPDYEIDYDRGTLLFRQPILRTDISADGEVLVRRIVVTYQFESQNSNTSIYAGRLQYNLARTFNQESWIGATYLRENQGDRDFELYGADALFSFGPNARLIAEYAHSKHTSDYLGEVSGSAYRLEFTGELIKNVLTQAYFRSTDAGFANNATSSFVPGQRRYGANITAAVSPTTKLRFQYDHEDNYGIAPRPLNTLEELFRPGLEPVPGSRVDNSLTTISAGVQQQFGQATLQLDWLHRDRQDRLTPNALSSTSDQLRTRFTMPVVENLTFFAQNEFTLSSETDAVYPDRTLLGLNWKVAPGTSVQLSQQFFTAGQFAGQSTTNLSVINDYKLGPDTTLTSRYTIIGGANGLTTQNAIGLNHRWVISPGLRLNVSYERIDGDLFGRNGTGVQFAQPFAVGQSAASLGVQGGESYSLGLEYSDGSNFQASARYEHRSSAQGSNTVISAGAAGKISPALTALVRYQQANAANQKLTGLGDTASLKVGLAYRDPNNDKFNALLRYEYRKNPSTTPDTILIGSGTGSTDHVLAAEAVYAPSWRWEFYGKYALRTSTTYLADDFTARSTVSLAQLRATYRLGYRWDVAGEVRWINQPSVGYSETGAVIEAGYYLTPNLRVAAGYAFGNVSDRDFNGSRSAGGPYLGLTIKLNELWGGFGQQRIPPPQNPPTKPVAIEPSVSPEQATAQAPSTPNLSEMPPTADIPTPMIATPPDTPVVPNTASTNAADLQLFGISSPTPALVTPEGQP